MNYFDTTVVVLLLAILAIQLYASFGKKENYQPWLTYGYDEVAEPDFGEAPTDA